MFGWQVASLKRSIEKLNDQCLQLEMTRDNATDVLDTAMEVTLLPN